METINGKKYKHCMSNGILTYRINGKVYSQPLAKNKKQLLKFAKEYVRLQGKKIRDYTIEPHISKQWNTKLGKTWMVYWNCEKLNNVV